MVRPTCGAGSDIGCDHSDRVGRWCGADLARSATADPSTDAGDDATRPLPGLVAKPASWLQRFLFDLGRSDQERDPNCGLEVVLPGKTEQ